jgi:hypothetical protein
MITSEAINEIAAALSAAQAEIAPAPKDATNPHFKSKYADLASVWGACRAALAKHNLAVIQSPFYTDGRVGLGTRIMHKSGQWLQSEFSMKPTQDTPQGMGSCLTYLRRYALSAMVGVVADEDDDGNEASKPRQVYSAPPPLPRVQNMPKPGVFTAADPVFVERLERELVTQKIMGLKKKVLELLEGKPTIAGAVTAAIETAKMLEG